MSLDRCEFLSSAWFARARSAGSDVSLPPASSCRLQFDMHGVSCALIIEEGRVVQFGPGVIANVDAVVYAHVGDAWDVATGARTGSDALSAITVSTVLATGETTVGLPAPMGLAGRPELDAMPLVTDATLTVQHQFADGPFGDVDYRLSFMDGRVVGEQLGRPEDPPDVFIAVSYRKMALVRAGHCTILEALEHGGRVEGNVSSLMAVAALYEHESFAAGMRVTGAQAMALATLGELRADDTFRSRMRALMRDTSPLASK